MGVESFRALLQKKEQDSDVNDRASECRSYDTTRQKRVKDTLDRLQELSQMFSHDETEVVTRIARSDDSTDTSSVISGVPTSVKYRQQAKRVIGAEEMLGDGLNLSSLTLNNNPGHTLPGAYQHVSPLLLLQAIVFHHYLFLTKHPVPPRPPSTLPPNHLRLSLSPPPRSPPNPSLLQTRWSSCYHQRAPRSLPRRCFCDSKSPMAPP
jgi:hypothetical protein